MWIPRIFSDGGHGRPQTLSRTSRRKLVVARYDAAQTTADNARHWAHADGLSADAATNSAVRRTLRNRARYEVANNSYARGIVLTLANDLVGTGPRLQLLGDGLTREQIAMVEDAFASWSARVKLAAKLRQMRMAAIVDGEAFAVLGGDRRDSRRFEGAATLDLWPIEADRVASTTLAVDDVADGISFADGYPSAYSVLRHHPGSAAGVAGTTIDTIPAEKMIHWFRADRAGQHRGVPEITPALPLFAQLRRYTLAVLAAAETAADFAAVLYSEAPANGEAAQVEPMDTVELEKRMATVLPDGWKLGQLKAEQPTTTYAEFKREILNEIARCLNMPYNIAAGNSSGYNYASGRLDHQTYYRSIRVAQHECAMVVLDTLLRAWLDEMALIPAYRFLRAQTIPLPHVWMWDGNEHVDPAKEANAQRLRLASRTTTLAAEYARQGKDWEVELRQCAREAAMLNELGLAPVAIDPENKEAEENEDADA